jgi:uncharacterized SAM-binding protein YcdF (DUF218 family)
MAFFQDMAQWLLPPSGPLLLALAGLLLAKFLLGRVLLVGGLLLLYLFSLPVVSYALIGTLQKDFWPPQEIERFDEAGAIVVLGAGNRSGAAEYSGETVGDLALVRVRYAAYVHRMTGLPVLATGGGPEGRASEASRMAEALEEFSVRPILTEEQARDTWGNASYSAALLDELGIRRVALVTHAYHMPRAVWAFQRTGLEVIPAPTGAIVPHDTTFALGSLRPQAHALYASWLAMHEYLGLVYYRLRVMGVGPR